MLTVWIVLMCLAALAVFLAAPGQADKAKKTPFLHRNFAHRGLYEKDQSVPENSLAAFRRAAEAGYGVELDVHLTADGKLAVFHDDDLKRMCAADGPVEARTYDELSALRLYGTDESVPLLADVLAVMEGRGPIILELKRGHDNETLCRLAREALVSFTGDVCIESFDPFIVRWWRMNAPEVLRGQLAATYTEMKKSTSRVNAFLLSRVLLNSLARPQFIAYGLCARKPLTVRLCERMGAMRVAWTSHDTAAEAKNDAVIFEHYRPAVRY